MKQSLRIVLAIALLSGLVARVAVARNCPEDPKNPWRSALMTVIDPTQQQTKEHNVTAVEAKICHVADAFDDWAEKESKDLGWIGDLPRCACENSNMDNSGKGEFEKPSYAKDDKYIRMYHLGAYMCYRSKEKGGHAQQCCYDDKGRLLTFGRATGTPDRVGLMKFKLNVAGHFIADVEPVQLAAAKAFMLLHPSDKSLYPKDGLGIGDAWIVYNALRDDPRVSDPTKKGSCPQNPASITMDNLVLKGKKTTVVFNNATRFLKPADVKAE